MFLKIFLFLALSTHVFAAKYEPPTSAELDQAVKTFKYKDQWISPIMIKTFMNYTSDHVIPMVTAIDVAAAYGSNRFHGAIKVDPRQKNRPIAVDHEETQYSYEWIGRLSNGYHAIILRESAKDARLVSTNLMVFELRSRDAIYDGGKGYKQLWLEIKRYVPVGDRAITSTKIEGNTIRIKAEYNTTEKPRELKISL